MKNCTSLRNTYRHLHELKAWVAGKDEPDYRDFPHNRKGDLILLLKPEKLYEPSIDRTAFGKQTSHVSRAYFNNVGFLKNSLAKVIGESDIPYYAPWETDLKLLCLDDKIRYIDAWDPCFKEDSFVFVPHPRLFDKFNPFLEEYLAKHYKKVRSSLMKCYYQREAGR